jgi:hypothetical protein
LEGERPTQTCRGHYIMSSIVTFWIQRIKAADPVLVAVAFGIAQQSAQDANYNVDAAVAAKLAEWKVEPESQMGRALNFAVINYQEDLQAKQMPDAMKS